MRSLLLAGCISLFLINKCVCALPDSPLSFRITGPPTLQTLESKFLIRAIITNTRPTAVAVLNDPRGPLSSTFPTDTFKITDPNGNRPKFKGVRLKYLPVAKRASDYRVLAPGESVEVEHDLKDAYDFSELQPGVYTITGRDAFYILDAATQEILPISARTISHQIQLSLSALSALSSLSSPSSLSPLSALPALSSLSAPIPNPHIPALSPLSPAIPLRFRLPHTRLARRASHASHAVYASSCTPAQRQIIELATQAAHEYAVNASVYLYADALGGGGGPDAKALNATLGGGSSASASSGGGSSSTSAGASASAGASSAGASSAGASSAGASASASGGASASPSPSPSPIPALDSALGSAPAPNLPSAPPKPSLPPSPPSPLPPAPLPPPLPTPTLPPPTPARYPTWFGHPTAQRHALVSAHFSALAAQNFTAFDYDCACADESVFAYVYPSQYGKVYLCGAFWAAPMVGKDSKGGTLVHETSHFLANAGGTRDYAYGQRACTALALAKPDIAVLNADSHEYFAENHPFLA